MKIDELLYHLHHSASIPEIEATELNQLLKKYPYLESLRHAIIQNPNTPFQAINDIDLQNRFIQLAARAYNYDNPGNVMSPPIFDVTPGMPEQSLSLEEYHFTPVEASLPSPFELNFIQNDTDSEKTDPSSRQDILAASQDTLGDIQPPFRLYPYEPSEFILYLQHLPACSVHPVDEVGIEKKDSMAATDEYIAASIDLQEGVSSESLANLWASQGKYEAAIKIYEKLGRENPEKSSIFAAKIAKLKAEKSL